MPLIDDRFQNVISAEVTMSAANALTFTEVNTGVSLGQGLGMVIDEIRYYPKFAAVREIVAATDDLQVGICTSDAVDNLSDYADSRILDTIAVVGRGTGADQVKIPLVSTFEPPLIIASPRLYLAADTSGAAAASVIQCRISFRYIKLTPQEYLEVAETFLNL